MQWAFVDDVAEVCVRALEVPEAAGEAFNIAHEPVSQREFVERLASVAGVTPRFVTMPRAAIGAAGGQLMGPDIYFGDYLDLPPHTEVVEKAPRMLGVSPTPFDTALGTSFVWYRAQPTRSVEDAFDQRLMRGDS
jgi:nucleoside-diphosphate-sugar epimerase